MTTRFLRRAEVERLTGLSRSTLYRLIACGRFPAPIKISPRSCRWPEDVIEAWQNQQREQA